MIVLSIIQAGNFLGQVCNMWGRFISFGPCNCDSKNAKGWMNKTASFFVVCLDVVLYMLGSN